MAARRRLTIRGSEENTKETSPQDEPALRILRGELRLKPPVVKFVEARVA